jgi:hypothetical protein
MDTCKPSWNATLMRVGTLRPSWGIPYRKASWASLKRCDGLWM